ncbi:MAG TPA: bifunctional nuclease domain-containing protein [Trebonia sp.]
MTRDESTAALVAAAQAGDKDAFGALATRYYPMTHAMCARFLGDGDRALDVTQEAVVTAMLSLDRLRDGERFGAWLTGIALNLCRRLVRNRDWASFSLDALLAAGLVAEPADGGPSPDDAAAAADVARRVRAAVAALPPGQRAAAEAYYLSGLPAADTAERIAVPATALKARLHRARRSLRASLLDLRPEKRSAMTSAPPEKEPTMVPVTISSALLYTHGIEEDIEEDEGGRRVPHHWMKLTETGGERALLIGVGQAEAVALALSLDGQEFPRPMTYQFAAALLESSGTQLREVRITRLTDGVFYAQAELSNGAVVDARPSDALNLAAITGVPVLVASDLLDLVSRPGPAPEG